jgi:hypothetical protein
MKRAYSHGYSISISPKAFDRLTADWIHTERGGIRKGQARWDRAINAALDAEEQSRSFNRSSKYKSLIEDSTFSAMPRRRILTTQRRNKEHG